MQTCLVPDLDREADARDRDLALEARVLAEILGHENSSLLVDGRLDGAGDHQPRVVAGIRVELGLRHDLALVVAPVFEGIEAQTVLVRREERGLIAVLLKLHAIRYRNAHPTLAEQAKEFQAYIHTAVQYFIWEAMKADRSKVITLLRSAGHNDLANSVENL